MLPWLTSVYLLNAVLVIVHEIDSAYWREWELFHLPGGEPGFLVIHLFLIALILFGLVLVMQRRMGGFFFSLLLSLGGLSGFGVHMWFLAHADPAFRTTASLSILIAMGAMSLIQTGLTLAGLRHR